MNNGGETFNINRAIETLIADLGAGRAGPSAYQSAWAARLTPRYHQFEASLEWLRHHQHDDGSWGGSLVHHHDRIISTLAAMIALYEVGDDARDRRRVRRGEQALWKYVGYLHHDHSDTVAFPILASALATTATHYGFDVPRMPVRFSKAFSKKVEALLNSNSRNWRATTLLFSLEGLSEHFTESDELFEENGSIGSSPSATSAFLLRWHHPDALRYIESLMDEQGGIQALSPINIFEIVWSLNHLRSVGAITPDNPQVRKLLDYLASIWSPTNGVAHGSHFPSTDSDDTAACLTLLRWGGYDVSSSVFSIYEQADHFSCYLGETNPSLSANVRLLATLRQYEDDGNPQILLWRDKIVNFLRTNDENGSFWWDKWHASPFYVNTTAINALAGLDDELAITRLRWILRTQRDDGGWGYLGMSTPEETAYCLLALMQWQRKFHSIEPSVFDGAAQYLAKNVNHNANSAVPLWISKELYTPVYPVRAAILAALFAYDSEKRPDLDNR